MENGADNRRSSRIRICLPAVFAVGLFSQVFIGVCAWLSYEVIAPYWAEVLPGEPLSWLTRASLATVRFLPIVALASLAAVVFVSRLRRNLLPYALTVITLEAMALAFIMLGLVLPALGMDYGLG